MRIDIKGVSEVAAFTTLSAVVTCANERYVLRTVC